MPVELWEVAVMDRVGGYAAYAALLDDAVMYQKVILAMQGEVDAQRLAKAEAEAKARAAKSRGR